MDKARTCVRLCGQACGLPSGLAVPGTRPPSSRRPPAKLPARPDMKYGDSPIKHDRDVDDDDTKTIASDSLWKCASEAAWPAARKLSDDRSIKSGMYGDSSEDEDKNLGWPDCFADEKDPGIPTPNAKKRGDATKAAKAQVAQKMESETVFGEEPPSAASGRARERNRDRRRLRCQRSTAATRMGAVPAAPRRHRGHLAEHLARLVL